MADVERWVNAVIEITVPLDHVSPDDPPERKMEAVGEITEWVLERLGPRASELVTVSRWEDVSDG